MSTTPSVGHNVPSLTCLYEALAKNPEAVIREKQPQLASKTPSINQKMEAAELQVIINRAIDQLPERCRIIARLFVASG